MQKNSSTFQIPLFDAPKASDSDANEKNIVEKAIVASNIDETTGLVDINIDGKIDAGDNYGFKYYDELKQISEEIEKCRLRNC